MKYYEIINMDEPFPASSRIISDDEFNRRLVEIIEADYNLDQAKEILLHGKVKEADPWEELVHELSDALGFLPGQQTTLRLEAALNKLKGLVEGPKD